MADNDGFEPINNNEQPNDQASDANAGQTPQVGNVITPGEQSTESVTPQEPTISPAQPAIAPETTATVNPDAPQTPSAGADGTSTAAMPLMPSGNQKPKKKWLLPVLIVAGIVIAGGTFFGIKQYTNSPNYVWNNSLKNTSNGYKTLVGALENYESKEYKAGELNGTVKASFEGGSLDMTMKGSSGAVNGELKTDVVFKGGEGDNTLSMAAGLDIVAVGESETSGDLYIRARDLDKAVNALSQFGMDAAQAQQMIQPYNNQWYVISSEDMYGMLGVEGSIEDLAVSQPKAKDLTDFLSSLNNSINDQLLSPSQDKAVLTQKEFIGKETKDGREVFHYKAGVNKENFKAFGKNLEKAYVDSKLGKWLAEDSGLTASEMFNYSAFESMVNDIDDNYTFDVWVDADSKRISVLRFTDADEKSKYTEIGVLQNGSKVDLTITSKSDDVEVKYTIAFDANSHVIDMTLIAEGDDSDENAFNIAVAFSIKPSNDEPKVEKPSGAKPLQELIESLGGGQMGGLGGLYGNPAAINQSDLELYEELYGDEYSSELERSLLFSN